VRLLQWFGRLWSALLIVVLVLTLLLVSMRWLLPWIAPAQPNVLTTNPVPNTTDVSPRSQIVFTFTTPMNPASVMRALQIEPTIPVDLTWNADRTTLTISPTMPLRAGTDYRVVIATGAMSRWFSPTQAPLTLALRTQPPPAIVAAMPPAGATVATNTTIGVRFNRPMASPSVVGQPVQLPELRFDPPIPGSLIWIDQQSLVFRPNAPLQPATLYRAELAASLTDQNGVPLGEPFIWRFTTTGPTVGSASPAANARDVALQTPLTFQIEPAIAPDLLRAGLTLSPTIAGQLDSTQLPNATQIVTFTPTIGWKVDTLYTVALQVGVAPPIRWSFNTASQPRLLGRFPGEGQLLPPEQNIQLVFNTPFDPETVRTSLQFEPPVSDLQVTANGNDLQINATLRAATIYTMTVPASLTSRGGVPLGQDLRLRFQTAPALPLLELPDRNGRLLQLAPDSPNLLIRQTNVSALDLELYPLDETTAVRVLNFNDDEWRTFSPERYGLTALRRWSVPLTSELNLVTDLQVPLTAADGQALAAGNYYLRISTTEGQRIDLLLILSNTRLVLLQHDTLVHLWLTDINGLPVGGAPLALFQEGGLVARGVSDANGLWSTRVSAGEQRPLLGLANGNTAAVVSSAWRISGIREVRPEYRMIITSDRSSYAPGETITVAGFVRRDGPTPSIPTPMRGLLTISRDVNNERVDDLSLQTTATGMFSASLRLPITLPDGNYVLGASFGRSVVATRVQVEKPTNPPLQLTITPPLTTQGSPKITITTSLPNLQPLANVAITWTLRTEAAPFPSVPGYAVGDPAQLATPVVQRGNGVTTENGQLVVQLSEPPAANRPLYYTFEAFAHERGGPTVVAQHTFLLVPGDVLVGARLSQQFLTVQERGQAELLVTTLAGQPQAGTRVQVELLRRNWPTGATERNVPSFRDERVWQRTLVTNNQGLVQTPLQLDQPGEYRLVASAPDANPLLSTAIPLFVTERGFRDWRPGSDMHVPLVVQSLSYTAGDTATLLPLQRFSSATALVAVQHGETVSVTVQPVRTGESLTTQIPIDSLASRVDLVLAEQGGQAGIALGGESLPLQPALSPLRVAVSSDQLSYAPGSTATITVTVSEVGGQGVAADLIIGVMAEQAAPYAMLTPLYTVNLPPPLIAKQLSRPSTPLLIEPVPANNAPMYSVAPSPGPTIFWRAGTRTAANGQVQVQVPLPQQAVNARVLVWAADTSRIAQAAQAIAVQPPLQINLDLPEVLYSGDSVTTVAQVRNATNVSQTVTLDFTAQGATLGAGTADQQTRDLAPGATGVITWPITVQTTGTLTLEVTTQNSTSATQQVTLQRSVAKAELPPPRSEIALLTEYLDPATNQVLDPQRLRLDQLVAVRITMLLPVPQEPLTLTLPLPGGATFVSVEPNQLSTPQIVADRLLIAINRLQPGIYEQRYLVRFRASGSFLAPPAMVRNASNNVLGVGRFDQVRVQNVR
jgi:uncharacterized protein YfaS (alpha-2-macroglobulin family)